MLWCHDSRRLKNRFAGELVTNHKAIACHYFKTWFLPDFAVFGPQQISFRPVVATQFFLNGWQLKYLDYFHPENWGVSWSNLRSICHIFWNGLVGEKPTKPVIFGPQHLKISNWAGPWINMAGRSLDFSHQQDEALPCYWLNFYHPPEKWRKSVQF